MQSIARGVNQRASQIADLRDVVDEFASTPMVSAAVWWNTILQFKKLEAMSDFRFASRQFIDSFPDHASCAQNIGL